MNFRTGILIVLLVVSCGLFAQTDTFFTSFMQKHKAGFGTWAQAPEKYDIQILYTQIDRDADNIPHFTTHRYRIDTGRYFYPASTVKMPAAILALEKLHQLNIVGLDGHTPMKVGATRPPQTPVITDASAEKLLPSVAHYARKIFLVSDNDAFNRLYEFLGQAAFNERLIELGFNDTRIIHRLSVTGYDVEGNRHTNPVSFYSFDTLLYHQGAAYSSTPNPLNGLQQQKQGVAYMKNDGTIINEPFDFSKKNFVSIPNLNGMLQRLLFPEAFAADQRYQLSAEDEAILLQAMFDMPQESTYPAYPKKGDNYVKFWMYGDQADSTDIPEHIRIFNKVGWAYGYLTDIAYIVDLESGVEFMLSGVIHVNANKTFNDGVYEYEKIGLPFFGELGRAIYDYELKRKRLYKPDLSRFDLRK